ncbi:MAG TPA: orotate phosphoribosyltransferase [Caulobacteraceae bacterium]|nr:orotate phosphoribosyltransferase [Caulobacteraceae bacterium]
MAAVAKLERTRGDGEAELKAIIRERSIRIGKFTLASGRESDLYLNLKPTMMDPRGARLCAEAFLARVPPGTDYVGGLEMGAVPVISALAAVSDIAGKPVRTFFVRKSAKDHGTREVVEGLAGGESLAGKRCLMVDDVATTGGSVLKAIDAARAAGAIVEDALVIVDRQEGGTETLAAVGVKLHSVFIGDDFR